MTENDALPLLSVDGLKTYFPTDEGLVKTVDGISFNVYKGKILGIVGESGCGKSTVGRSILGIIDNPGQVEAGSIIWRQEPIDESAGYVDLTKQSPNGKLMRSIRGRFICLVFQEPMTSFSPVHTIGNQLTETNGFPPLGEIYLQKVDELDQGGISSKMCYRIKLCYLTHGRGRTVPVW